MSKNKSVFYSEKIERYFLSEDDARIYDEANGTNEWANKNSFDALTDKKNGGKQLKLEFTAKAIDYFHLWVVCHALTLLTLGAYGPWARTRKAEFLGRHWLLDGQSFQVRFVPLALLRGRVLLLFLLLLAFSIGWWNPWLTPVVTAVTFIAAPWLLANSFAFRWRTLTHRGIRFDSKNQSAPLKVPLIALGVFLALNQLPFSYLFLIDLIKKNLFIGLILMLVSIFVYTYFWSAAVSALTHFRFSQARWGGADFVLGVTPRQLLRHTMKILFSLPVAIFFISIVYVIGIIFVAGDRNAMAVAWTLYYLMLIVYSTTFARGRRLNFVLHRLSIGGLTFNSTIKPTKAAMLTVAYALMALFTLGLSIPWSTVHFNRWRQKHIQIYLEGEWDQFLNLGWINKASSTMDELGNSIDIEVGL